MSVDGLQDNKTAIASEILSDIKTVCKDYPARCAGSESERAAMDFMRQKLEGGADEIKCEKFSFYPAAYFGWTVLSVTCLLFAYVTYFFSTMVALLLVAVAIIPYVFEFMLNKRTLDPLYKSAQSQNILACKKPVGEVKKRLYFVAHADASKEWRLKYKLGNWLFMATRVLNFVGILYLVAITCARWALVGEIGASIAQGPMLYAGLAGLVFAACWCMSYFFLGNKVIDGANSDLSGCFVAIAAFNELGKRGVTFEDTEVGVLLLGAGMVGLRGAKAWCDAHVGEYDDNTAFVALDTLREREYLKVNTTEMYKLVKNDEGLVELVRSAADGIGLPLTKGHIPYCSTDSAVFSQKGLRSVSISAVNSSLPDYFRTRYDTYDNMSAECIADSFELCMAIVQAYCGCSTLGGQEAKADNVASAETDAEQVEQ